MIRFILTLAALLVAAPAFSFDVSQGGDSTFRTINVGALSVQGIVQRPAQVSTVFGGNGTGIDVQFGPNAEPTARPGGLPQFDGIRSMITVEGRQGVGQVSAINGTVRGRVAAGVPGNNGFPVAGFLNATCEVNNCNVWSLNTLATDSGLTNDGDRSEPGATGRVMQNEFDFTVWNETTVVKALSAVLNGQTKNVGPQFAFIAEKNESSVPWAQGFTTADGAARVAYLAGPAQKTGSNIRSQPFAWNYFAGDGSRGSVEAAVVPSSTGTYLTLSGGDGLAASNVKLSPGGSVVIPGIGSSAAPIVAVTTNSSNQLVIGTNAFQAAIATQLVPSSPNTQAVGTPASPFGTVAANMYYSGTSAGVSCSGAPTANFTVANGIVIRC